MRSERTATTIILVVLAVLAFSWIGSKIVKGTTATITDRIERIQESTR